MSASQIQAEGIDAKAAVRAAKDFVADMFAEESPINIGLEEIAFDPEQSLWFCQRSRRRVGWTARRV
jgi:hypothetical protein